MKFQLCCNKLEWVDLKTQERKKNLFCYSTHKFYIKDGKNTCHFVRKFKLKPIYYGTFFKPKYHSDLLTEIIGSIIVSKTKIKASTTYSTGVKNTSDQVPGQISALNEPQENLSNSDAVTIDQAY